MSIEDFEDSDMDLVGFDDLNLESEDYWGESDDLDAESRAGERRRMQRLAGQRVARRDGRVGAARRQLALQAAQQQRLRAGMAGPRPAPSVPTGRLSSQTEAAMRNVSFESKAREEASLRANANRDRRLRRQEMVTVASLAANQLIESFNKPADPIAKAGVRALPLLLMSPQRRGSGLEGILTDPRVFGLAAVLGIAAAGAGKFPLRRNEINRINITAPDSVAQNTSLKVYADVIDGKNLLLDKNVEWESSDESIATVDKGMLSTKPKSGPVTITAKADGVVQRFRINVT